MTEIINLNNCRLSRKNGMYGENLLLPYYDEILKAEAHNIQKSEGCKEMQSERNCFIKRKKGY